MKKTKLVAFVWALSAAASVAADETAHTGFCRAAHVKMSEDDYHRVKGLMPQHDVTLSREGEAFLDFGNIDYPQTAILQKRLQRYGGLKCVNTAEWYAARQHVVTHKVGKGYIDCVISDFGKTMPDKDYQRVICLPMRYQ